ncbi:MAG TPA: subclass B1 metallo-beta-lactamase [Clostridia bacterium]|nr:subclass B1 metallo-beta-lactamase [Clostridia bacterium]
MKKACSLIIIFCSSLLILTAFTNGSDNVKVKEGFFKSGTKDSNYVELTKLNENIWVHTTYQNYNGTRTPSNGVIAISSKGLLLVDTPWNNTQTKELISLTKKVFKKNIRIAIITHAHADRIGGIDTLISNKIEVRSTALTVKEAEKNGYRKPQPKLYTNTKFSLGKLNVEEFYPGAGHTKDNITVWFPQYKVLYGGCLVKSLEADSIGNTEDADLKQWPLSIKKVQEKYSSAKTIIPGHGMWGDKELLKHTLELLGK